MSWLFMIMELTKSRRLVYGIYSHYTTVVFVISAWMYPACKKSDFLQRHQQWEELPVKQYVDVFVCKLLLLLCMCMVCMFVWIWADLCANVIRSIVIHLFISSCYPLLRNFLCIDHHWCVALYTAVDVCIGSHHSAATGCSHCILSILVNIDGNEVSVRHLASALLISSPAYVTAFPQMYKLVNFSVDRLCDVGIARLVLFLTKQHISCSIWLILSTSLHAVYH